MRRTRPSINWHSSKVEINRMHGVQNQSAPVTLVHVLEGQAGKEQSLDKQEETGTSSRVIQRTVTVGGRDEGFLVGSVFDATVTATEISSFRQEERKTEAGCPMTVEISQQVRRDLGHHWLP